MRLGVHRPFVTSVALAAASMLASACEVNLQTEGLSQRESRRFSLTGQPDVTLDTFNGAIELHAWDRQEVDVEVEKRATDQALVDQIIVEAEQTGNTIVLRVKGPARRALHGVTIGASVSPTANLRVTVPRSLVLHATSGDGAIRAEGLSGTISLRTDDGSVTASGLSGEVDIRTGDGAIRVDRATGRLALETGDGSIGLDGAPTVLRARTSDGSIRARVDANTLMADNWEVTTNDGSIVLTLPPAFNGDLDAETRDGSVRASHPALAGEDDRPGEDRDERRERQRWLRARMGEGGKLLRVRSGDGSIRIES